MCKFLFFIFLLIQVRTLIYTEELSFFFFCFASYKSSLNSMIYFSSPYVFLGEVKGRKTRRVSILHETNSETSSRKLFSLSPCFCNAIKPRYRAGARYFHVEIYATSYSSTSCWTIWSTCCCNLSTSFKAGVEKRQFSSTNRFFIYKKKIAIFYRFFFSIQSLVKFWKQKKKNRKTVYDYIS
jgi:hypothetical protein